MWRLALLAMILWFSSTGYCQQQKENFWCVQFFNKSVPHPLHMEIDEITPVGTVIRQFEVPKEDNLRIVLNEGDTRYLEYDNKGQRLLVKKSLKTRLNSVLELSGVCTHNVKSYNYLFNLTVQFYVHVKEYSDPPQFLNLPTVHEVPEKTKVDKEIFKVEGEDSFDVNRSNITYRLVSLSARNSWANVDHMFFMDSEGRVYLKEKLDYDKGLRFFDLEIEIEDADEPPQTNTSKLTIKVTDNDDQPPRFDHSEYHISLIGERPITTEECYDVTPPMNAEDLDPVKKSIIKYKIISGTPSDWSDFFRLQEDNGSLCQLKIVERSQPGLFSSEPGSFPTYVLRVEAYQVDNPLRKHSAKLTVKIDNQNIHAPTFTQKLYRANINEYPALKRRDKVITLTAKDGDYGVNKQFRYEIIQNYKNGFTIDRKTGDIFVTRPLVVDREDQGKIELKVRAVETESEERKESDPHARVILTVMDVNDNSPKFKKMFYSFEIKDSLEYNELVHPIDENLEAKDPDLAENGTVVYTITRVTRQDGRASFNDISRFKMDEEGNLRVGQGLRDLRRKGTFPEYRVTVRAEDQVKDPKLRRSSTAQVDLKVLEANDYPPIFQSKRLSVAVSEATAVGSRVTKLEATDEDGDEDLYLTYKIIGGNEDNTFSISKSGYLTTAKILDRETKKKYELTAEVSDGVHESEATVEVNVDDVNDHAPEFIKSTFEFALMENATQGEIFGSVTAVDEDTGINGRITYTLVGKGAEYFGIKANGDIFVRRTGKLIDKEQNDNIILQIKAVDAGIPPSQDVASISIDIVDVNDNAPVFSKSIYQGYTEEGQSNSSKNSLIRMEHKIEARDADKTAKNRNIRYRLSGSGSEKFSLHPVTGVIRVNNPASIDCELKCEYRLEIIARDQKGVGLEGRAELVINVKDVNDNAPKFDEDYVINIEPWTTVGTKITTIKATDNDITDQNNKIMYLLRAGGVGKFQLDFDTGDLLVVDKLTRSPELEEYILEIKAIDSGQPRLSANGKVTIRTTVNQQPIMKSKHHFEIPESLPVDSLIGKINATNPDDAKGLVQKLKYVIPDEHDVPFKVDADSGVLETKSVLDAETENKYVFPIIVTDNGYPPSTVSTTVTIDVTDVNDEPPRFAYDTYFGSIVEDDNQPIKKQKVKLEKAFSHTDKDQTPAFQTVTFSLSGKESKLFIIDAITSEISVAEPGSIDCEKSCRFEMMVDITNDAAPHLTDSAVLTINVTDINDNGPILNKLPVIQIPRNTPVDTILGQVSATDNDHTPENNKLTYILMGGGFDKFGVDMNTGSIKVIDDLSREPQHEEYQLHVMAEDSGVPKQTIETIVRIQIPLNKPPTLPDEISFDVREGVTINSSVGRIEAIDPDVLENKDYLEYSLDSKAGPFVIDKLKGELFVARELDAEINGIYEFLVTAIDHGIPQRTATSTVIVRITDVNDNPPIFEEVFGYKTTIPEGFQGLLPIVPAIRTKDADIGLGNQEVKFSLKGYGSEFFKINPYTAGITVRYGHHLDCEDENYYSLQIVAKNKKLVTRTSLEINIEDLNDHTPEFLDEYTFVLDPDTRVGTTIGQLQARDTDRTSKNNQFTFFLKSGSFEKFAVDAKTGEITLAASLLNDPQREKYNLDVVVSDSGFPQLSSISRINISVPLNKPPTLSNHNEFFVYENASQGYILGKIECEDPELISTKTNRIAFSLQRETDLFAIDQTSGLISLTSQLDAEISRVHHLGLRVVDWGSPSFTVSTTVTVHVLDSNDNPPILNSETGYDAVITEGMDMNRIIVTPQIMATDSDVSEENRKIVYSLRGQGADVFILEPATAALRMRDYRLIDCEITCEYNLTIVSSDPADVSMYSNRRLTIRIKDGNDNNPVFEKNEYQLSIPPDQTLGSTIASIKATDADFSQDNNRITYSLVRGGIDRFSLDSQSGELTLIANLTSVPLIEEYAILIKAVDSGVPQRSASATVNIYVTLNKPPKVPKNVQFSVYENTTLGVVLGRITATDPDDLTNSKGNLEYSMENEDILKIDKVTGEVRLLSRLDAEIDLVHHSLVVLTDNGLPSFTTSTTLTIQVLDVNDNPPNLIVEHNYHAIVAEGVQDKPIPVSPPIAVTDSDVLPENKKVRYTLHGAGNHKFKIDNYGILRVRPDAKLDCEKKCEYFLKVRASDPDINTLSSVANLKISIDDLNDNAPLFEKSNYRFTVYPFSPFGQFIGTIKATDKDFTFNNNQVTYDLLCENCRFRIDPSSGRLTLASNLSESPFHEKYNFMVIAKDSGIPSLFTVVNVTVRVPLNRAPEIKKNFQFNVTEDMEIGHVLGQVSAFDPDSSNNRNQEIVFQLQDNSGHFVINKSTGVLTINNSLDAENVSTYNMDVIVVNLGIPVINVTTSVTITVMDINDHPPILTANGYVATVTEGTAPGYIQLIPTLKTVDLDVEKENQQVVYRLSGENHGKFYLDSFTGSLKVKDDETIDCEEVCAFHLKVTALDPTRENLFSEAPLTINVKDTNDNKPVFSSSHYHFSVQATVPVGFVLGHMKAYDADVTEINNQIRYYILHGGYDKFSINNQTGELTVKTSLASPPYFEDYRLEIQAIDSGHPQFLTAASVNIHVPLNKQPLFPKRFHFNVSENATIGQSIGRIESETDDGSSFAFSLKGETDIFKIHRKSGELKLMSVVDAEHLQVYKFHVVVFDNGIPPHSVTTSVKVNILDSNDNPPMFASTTGYTATVKEGNIGQKIHTKPSLSVTDADMLVSNRKVVYILQGEGNEKFHLNSSNGSLSLNENLFLDCEEKSEYNLTIIARDPDVEGLWSKAPLRVIVQDINDNVPEFKKHYNHVLKPNVPTGTIVGIIEAFDDDATEENNQMIYSLLGGGFDKFSINSHTGELTVADSLIREPMHNEYTLAIAVFDNGSPRLSSETTVKIIIPENHPPSIPPFISFELFENQLRGAVIGKVEAKDEDIFGNSTQQLNYTIIGEVPFMIVPDVGIIRTTSNLDAEEQQKYTFTIVVSDGGIPVRNASSSVSVNVQDTNDHAPIFACGDMYNATITEEGFDTSINVFPPISAKDHDISPANQNITYQLQGEGSDKFVLDPLTATIKLRRPLSIDCEKQCEYLLKVVAIDQGGRGKQTEADLYIDIIDINDNRPEFKEDYSFSVSPSTPVGSLVGHIEAFDRDKQKPNNIFTYILKEGAKGKFKLDTKSGILTVAENLLSEPLQEIYRLTVEVIDFGTPQRSSETTVQIYVPLNKPADVPLSVICNIKENEPSGSKVGRINVTNPDEDSSDGKSAVTFRILENDHFDVDPTSGEIKSMMMLDAETQETYKFSVIVLDEGFPTFTSTVSVTVHIEDINDHSPVLSSSSTYFAEITEGYYSDYSDIQLTPPLSVTDKDATEKNRLTHLSLVGYGAKYFMINSTTGQLQIKEQTLINCEKKCKFELKIKARNYQKPGLKAVANIFIKVKDINDHPPLIDELPPIHISPITERGTVIARLTAKDLDRDQRNNQFMFVLQNDPSFKFNIHPLTGDIIVVDKLSREPQREQYNLQVLAMDFGYPSLSSNTTVKIRVPINNPVTVAPTNAFHVSEGVAIGTQVGTVNASDPDITQDNQRSLTYILNDSTVPFKIGNKTGIIQTAGDLDAELASTYQFDVQILDSDLPPTTAQTTVTIVVEDINDNAPELSSKVYKTAISEGEADGSALILNLNPPLSAEDKDKNLINRHIRFFLKGKNADLFRLAPRTGILKIKDTTKLDCEKEQKYKLSIVAFDGTFQSQANLIIEVGDINDNRPIFSGEPYFYHVNPRATIGTKFGQVVAKDEDVTSRNNRILYVLAKGSGGKFGVDFLTGDIYVASNLTDSPQEDGYNLVIQAFDTGEPSLASNTTVRVRVALNKAPVVDANFVFQVPENMTIGSTVGMIPVFDPDTEHNPLESIKFRLSDPTNNFAISEYNGRITTKTVLDRETQEQFIFTVYCVNDGAPPHTVSTTITVFLEDINDNQPIFKSATGYHGTYKEGDPRGTISLNQELIATDADVTVENQNIVYHLVGNDTELFQLDPATGSIKVKSPSRIHCNYKDNYTLKIIAADQGGKGHESMSKINIEVQDINDNAPRFTKKYYFHAPITAREGTVIGTVMAIDNDCTQQNNRITYLLKDGGFGKFKIDPDKGDIIVADSLFREPMRNEYSIVVKAADNGAPGLSGSTNVTILVPVNHPPSVQKSFYFRTMEAGKIGQYVGKLTADDKDLGKVKGEKLTFTSVDKTVPFSVHLLSGEIRTNDIIDREGTEFYKFQVMVKDNGVPAFTATTDVIITIRDFNDNAPQFIHGLEYHGTLVEDDRNPIAKQKVKLSKNLTVIDNDATSSNRQIRFSLKGPRSRLFKINSYTGDIYVDRPGKIDRELNRQFKLKIVATDQNGKGLSTEADLTVEVEDVNDHAPRFVQALYEFVLPSIVEAGYEVGRLIAIDRDDTSPNNQLLYIFESDALGKFKIDVGTGVLTLLEGFFSKPRKTTYTFTVAAMDMGFPSKKTKAQVIVNAPHMVYNDHAPKFEGRNVFILKEELPIGSLVGTLQVTDEDRKKNNSVNLIIDPADERYVPFAIKNDGSLITTRRIDRDAGYEYFRFTLHATDSGAPPHNTSQEVGIIVDDINDNPPHFTMDTYQHMVSTNFPASTIIATPFAFDDVDKTDSVYQYSLRGGTPGYFYIDQQTGVIRTTDLAHTLKSGKMEFKVIANDLYNKTLTAEATLKIQIIQNKQGKKAACCRVPC